MSNWGRPSYAATAVLKNAAGTNIVTPIPITSYAWNGVLRYYTDVIW